MKQQMTTDRAVRRSTRPGDSGFTLLELLVSVSVTLLLAGLMLVVTNNLLLLWRRNQARLTQAITAKQILDLAERDLQTALRGSAGSIWLAADIFDNPDGLANHGWLLTSDRIKPGDGGSLRPLPSPDAAGVSRLADARFGLSGVWLRLIATNVESAGSLPTVVAYQMVRRPVTGSPEASNPAPVHYSLYRSSVSPAATFANGYDVTAGAYGSTDNTPSSALSTAYRLPRNVTNPSHANLLASNVVDFGCWFYRRDAAGGLIRIYPESAVDTTHHAIGGSTADGSRFPDVVDVMVRILSEEGATLIQALESGRVLRPPDMANDAAWWWSVVDRHSAVFVRRVEIKGMAP